MPVPATRSAPEIWWAKPEPTKRRRASSSRRSRWRGRRLVSRLTRCSTASSMMKRAARRRSRAWRTSGGGAMPSGTSPTSEAARTEATAAPRLPDSPVSSLARQLVRASRMSQRPGHARPRSAASRMACSTVVSIWAVPNGSPSPRRAVATSMTTVVAKARAASAGSWVVWAVRRVGRREPVPLRARGPAPVRTRQARCHRPDEGMPAPYPRRASRRA